MKTREQALGAVMHRVGLVCLVAIVCALAGCGGANGDSVQVDEKRSDGKSMTDDDEAAAAFISSELAKYWVKTADGWTNQLQQHNVLGELMPDRQPNTLYKQYRNLAFTMAPEFLTESMKLNGTDYRASAQFKDTAVRFYNLEATYDGPKGWSNWKDEMLRFRGIAVERRNGKWLLSDDNLFEGVKPDPSAIPSGA